ncbi:hypothetical protein PAMA_011451 [Pampus argenteus]
MRPLSGITKPASRRQKKRGSGNISTISTAEEREREKTHTHSHTHTQTPDISDLVGEVSSLRQVCESMLFVPVLAQISALSSRAATLPSRLALNVEHSRCLVFGSRCFASASVCLYYIVGEIILDSSSGDISLHLCVCVSSLL